MTTAVKRDIDLTILEALDFEPTLPCEHSGHERTHEDEPATLLVRKCCPGCGEVKKYMLCRSGWVHMGRYNGLNGWGFVKHTACGWLGLRDETLTILTEL